MGREVDFPRRTCAYGVDYKYTGQVQKSAPLDSAPTAVREVVSSLREVSAFTGHNAALLNWYDAAANEYMGAHSDDEKELVRLKNGGVCVVMATHNIPQAHRLADQILVLRNGCLVPEDDPFAVSLLKGEWIQ